jgi:DNA-nicking Smr family endonuclease
MSRKRKRARAQQQDEPTKSAPPPTIGTALGLVLKQAGVTLQPARQVDKVDPKKAQALAPHPAKRGEPLSAARVAPPPRAAGEPSKLTTTELRMLNDAYEGARPLAPKKPRAKPISEQGVATRNPGHEAQVRAQVHSEELAARTRLAALVSEGVRFKIRREDDYVEGLRADTSPKLLARIQGRGFSPEASLDLHGMRATQVAPAIERFVRNHQRRGARHVLLIVGKGLHSEDGTSVLAPAAVEALTHGLPAPWVVAFCTAHSVHGGVGAIAVLLRD